MNLLDQLVYSRKLFFVSDSLKKIDANFFVIYVLIKVEDMDFDRKLMIIKGGALPDVCNPVELFIFPLNGDGVYSGFGA